MLKEKKNIVIEGERNNIKKKKGKRKRKRILGLKWVSYELNVKKVYKMCFWLFRSFYVRKEY